ncbi:hypothetical protein GCM10007908_12840 [Rhizobium albus]|nr:hypothetical protein GCM10007908_12840 [Rhizobium albus]
MLGSSHGRSLKFLKCVSSSTSLWINALPIIVCYAREGSRKSIDIVIGSFCIKTGSRLLHDDRDFTAMAAHLDLKIY